jgi:hypothetical protein
VTNAEREKRLAAIRERLRRANPRTWRQRWAMSFTEADNLLFCAADDLDFLLAELDYLEVPLHDLLAEHTTYADGYRAGLEEGARRERGGRAVCLSHPEHEWARGAGPLGEPWRVCLRCGRTEPHPEEAAASAALAVPPGVEVLDLHAQAQHEALPHA